MPLARALRLDLLHYDYFLSRLHLRKKTAVPAPPRALFLLLYLFLVFLVGQLGHLQRNGCKPRRYWLEPVPLEVGHFRF